MPDNLPETDGSEVIASELDFATPGEGSTLDWVLVQQVLVAVARKIAKARNDPVGQIYSDIARQPRLIPEQSEPFRSQNEFAKALDSSIRFLEESRPDPAYLAAYRDVVRQTVRILREQSGLPAEKPTVAPALIEDTRQTVSEMLSSSIDAPSKQKTLDTISLREIARETIQNFTSRYKGASPNPYSLYSVDHLASTKGAITSLAELSKLLEQAFVPFDQEFQSQSRSHRRKKQEEFERCRSGMKEIDAEILRIVRERFDLPEKPAETVEGRNRPALTAAIMNEKLRELSQRVIGIEMTTPLAPPDVFNGTKAVAQHLDLALQTFAGLAAIRRQDGPRLLGEAMNALMEELCSTYAVPVDSPIKLRPVAVGPDGRPAPVQLGGGATMRTVSLQPGETFSPTLAAREVVPKSPKLTQELWQKIYTEHIEEHFMMKMMFHRDYREDISRIIETWGQVSAMARNNLQFPVTDWGAMEETWGLWEGALVLHPSVTDPLSKKFLTEEAARRKRNLERLFYSFREACELKGKPHLSLTQKPDIMRSTMVLPETVLYHCLQGQLSEGPPELLAWVGQQPMIQTYAEYETFCKGLSAKAAAMDLQQYGLTYSPKAFDEQLEKYFALPGQNEKGENRELTSDAFYKLLSQNSKRLFQFNGNFGPARVHISDLVNQWNRRWDAVFDKLRFPLTTWEQFEAPWREANEIIAVPDGITDPLERLAVQEMVDGKWNWQHHFWRMVHEHCELEGSPTLFDPTQQPEELKRKVLFPEIALATYMEGQPRPTNMTELATWASDWPIITSITQLDAFLAGLSEAAARIRIKTANCETKVRKMVQKHFTLPPHTRSAHAHRTLRILGTLFQREPGRETFGHVWVERVAVILREQQTDLSPITSAYQESLSHLQMLADQFAGITRDVIPTRVQKHYLQDGSRSLAALWNVIGTNPPDAVGGKMMRDLWFDGRFPMPPILAVAPGSASVFPEGISLAQAWQELHDALPHTATLTEESLSRALSQYETKLLMVLSHASPDAVPHVRMLIRDSHATLGNSLLRHCEELGWKKAVAIITRLLAEPRPERVMSGGAVFRTLGNEIYLSLNGKSKEAAKLNQILSEHLRVMCLAKPLTTVTEATVESELATAHALISQAIGNLLADKEITGDEADVLIAELQRCVPLAKESCLLQLMRHQTLADRLVKNDLLTANLPTAAAWPTGMVVARGNCPSLNAIERLANDAAKKAGLAQPDAQTIAGEARQMVRVSYEALLEKPIQSTNDVLLLLQSIGGVVALLRQQAAVSAERAAGYQAVADAVFAHFRQWMQSSENLSRLWPNTSQATSDEGESDAEQTDTSPETVVVSDVTGDKPVESPARQRLTEAPSFHDDIDFPAALDALAADGQDAAKMIASALQHLAPADDQPNGELAGLVRGCLTNATNRSYATIGHRLWLMLRSQRKRPGFLATAQSFTVITEASEFLEYMNFYRTEPVAAPDTTEQEMTRLTEETPELPAADEAEPAAEPTQDVVEPIIDRTPVAPTAMTPTNERLRMAPLTPAQADADESPDIAPAPAPAGLPLPRTPDAPRLPKRPGTEMRERLKKLGLTAESVPTQNRVLLARLTRELRLIEEALTVETDADEREAIVNQQLDTYLILQALLTSLRNS